MSIGRVIARLGGVGKRVTESFGKELSTSGSQVSSAVKKFGQLDADRAPRITWRNPAQPLTSTTLPRRRPAAVPFTGIDPETGRSVAFRPSDVLSKLVTGHDGRPIGVSFPTKKDDSAVDMEFGQAKHRTADTQVSELQANPPVAGQESSSTVGNRYGAPWSTPQGAPRVPPVYVMAHGAGNSFMVKVNMGTPTKQDFRTIEVDGSTYGRVVAANDNFHRAMAENPGRPVALISCRVVEPGGSAAVLAGAAMQKAGVSGRIWAPTGKAGTWYDEKTDASFLGVERQFDEAGNPVPLFKDIPAPGAKPEQAPSGYEDGATAFTPPS